MHRSGSTSRASAMEMDQLLPTDDPQSDAAKKEAMKMRLAENMVHLIPLVLIICAVVLWFFSHPDIDGLSRDESILARVKNMTIEGYGGGSNWNGSAVSAAGMEDLDPIDGIGMEDPGKDFDGNLRP